MKILLVNPNRRHYPGAKGPRAVLPLGLLYIAGELERQHQKVEVLDCLLERETKVWKEEDITLHGVSKDYFQQKIIISAPDIIGVSVSLSAQLEGALEAIEWIREVEKEVPIVVGGAHISAVGEAFLYAHDTVDYCIVGEGEHSFAQLVNVLELGESYEAIPGLGYRKNGAVIINQPLWISDLDALAFPAYHLINMDAFFTTMNGHMSGRAINGHNRSISMITSRGCPFTCIFCSIHIHMGQSYRAHSVEYTMRHLQYVIKRYGITHIAFEDDNFNLDKKRCLCLCEEIVKTGISFAWTTPNGIRADKLDDDLLIAMKRSGCQSLTIAAESGSQKIIDELIGKKIDLQSVVDVAELCNRHCIDLTIFFVIGIPGETIDDMQKTIDFAIELNEKYNAFPSIFSATPLFGTRLYDLAFRQGFFVKELTPQALSVATQPISGEPLLQTSEFSPNDIKKLARRFASRRKKRSEKQ